VTVWRNVSSRRYLAAVVALCLLAGSVAAFERLRPTSAGWTDPVYARGDVVIGTWSSFTAVDAVSAGSSYTCLRIDGQVWCSGESADFAPKTGRTSNTSEMFLVGPGARGASRVSHLDTGYNQTCIVAEGAAYCFGISGGSLGNYKPATPWDTPASAEPVAVYAGDDDGTTWGYRSPLYQQTVTRVFSGEQTACAVMATGRAACWGQYTYLTRPPTSGSDPRQWPSAPIFVPTTAEDPSSQLPEGSVIEGIGTEFQNSCAQLATGPLYCWGKNDQGQLGLPATEVLAPRALARGASGTGPITYVAMGTFHLCFLSGGAAYCAGLRAGGAVGDGSADGTTTEPVAVVTTGALSGVVLTKIVAGNGFTCALSDAGRAYCWGGNYTGQLGNNGTDPSLVPTAVDMTQLPSGVTFTDIDAGTNHMCGRGSDGNVYCWGSGGAGEQATGSNPASVLRPQTPVTDTWTAP
jgi:alpha-tubulin suppressor-like RCC1 family protein